MKARAKAVSEEIEKLDSDHRCDSTWGTDVCEVYR